ncbi:MAG: DUF502 domain-containing protein [Bacteroidetes bacterium]|nr:MAG: DUF502 domain-containing protein [Bacteroidota bacterium]
MEPFGGRYGAMQHLCAAANSPAHPIMKPIQFTTRRLAQYFLQGLLVIAPITVTGYLIVQLFNWLDGLIPIYINLSGNAAKPFFLPGLGFIIVFVGIVLVGYASSFFIINRVFSVFDHWLEKTPGIKIIYSFVKDFSEAFGGKKRKFQKPVLVSIYQPDVWQIGFVTNEEMSYLGMPDFITVYIPSSYAVAGTLFVVKSSRVRPLTQIAPADALKFAISGGVVDVDEPANT